MMSLGCALTFAFDLHLKALALVLFFELALGKVAKGASVYVSLNLIIPK